MANSARIDELQRRFAENPRRYFAPLANEYRKNGNLEQAILICQEYLPQQPGHMSGHIVYGQTLYEAGRFAEARAVFETALALDPENLIALHHLGDIAREVGDVDTARSWYRRVLETDPRNDEIIQLLAQLESASPTAIAAVTDVDIDTDHVASPNVSEYEPTAVPPIPTPPAAAEELLGFEPTSVPSFDSSGAVDTSAEVEPHVEEPSVSAAGDTDAFELVPVETAAAGTATDDALSAAAEPEPQTEPEPLSEPSAAESTAEEEIAVTNEAVDVPTAAARADALDAELFGDEAEISHVDDDAGGVELSPEDAHRESAEADIEREESIFETPPRSAEVHSLVDAEAARDVAAEPAVEPVLVSAVEEETSPIDGGHNGRETPPAPETAFVTETMADLYLRQGHLESALDIFRQLVAQRPADEHLRGRLQAVEELLFGATVELPAQPVPTPPPSPAPLASETTEAAVAETSAPLPEVVTASTEIAEQEPGAVRAETTAEPASARIEASPSIREFLAGILARQSTRPSPSIPETKADDATERATMLEPSTPEAGISEVATTEAASVAAATQEPSDQPADLVSETSFDTTPAPDANVTAATVLAEAFSDDEAAAPLEGVPAHRAPNELSLDHVFRTPSNGVESAAFSFDRFFSEESKEKKPAPAPEPQESTTGALDDIAQFNAWLNGLKKS